MAEAMSVVIGDFGKWPSSPGAQRGDSGVWRKIVALVRPAGIPASSATRTAPATRCGTAPAGPWTSWATTRTGWPLLPGPASSVLELIHRTRSRDYGITRGHYNAMPHQWPLHRNHLHVAMAGGTITEPIMGVGASGTHLLLRRELPAGAGHPELAGRAVLGRWRRWDLGDDRAGEPRCDRLADGSREHADRGDRQPAP
jgi:hypothetical protein